MMVLSRLWYVVLAPAPRGLHLRRLPRGRRVRPEERRRDGGKARVRQPDGGLGAADRRKEAPRRAAHRRGRQGDPGLPPDGCGQGHDPGQGEGRRPARALGCAREDPRRLPARCDVRGQSRRSHGEPGRLRHCRRVPGLRSARRLPGGLRRASRLPPRRHLGARRAGLPRRRASRRGRRDAASRSARSSRSGPSTRSSPRTSLR